jgi:hypothetical protein
LYDAGCRGVGRQGKLGWSNTSAGQRQIPARPPPAAEPAVEAAVEAAVEPAVET